MKHSQPSPFASHRRVKSLTASCVALVLIWAMACSSGAKKSQAPELDDFGEDASAIADQVKKEAALKGAAKEVLPEVPPQASLPHPQGYQFQDLEALFVSSQAPQPATLVECAADFDAAYTQAQSPAVLRKTVEDLVEKDGVKYHWCFYAKLIEAERSLQSDQFIDEKQKIILKNFGFLVPVARAFLARSQDSRYLRWAVRRYRQVSQNLFHRRLELTPQATSELVEASDPFDGWRESSDLTRSLVEGGAPEIKIEKDKKRLPASNDFSDPLSEPLSDAEALEVDGVEFE